MRWNQYDWVLQSEKMTEMSGIIWATSWENLFLPYVNNKGTDQAAQPHSLISAFVVRCLDLYNTSTCYIENFKTLASFCRCAGRFESYLVGNP